MRKVYHSAVKLDKYIKIKLKKTVFFFLSSNIYASISIISLAPNTKLWTWELQYIKAVYFVNLCLIPDFTK